jgi:hypothetical protein
MAGSVFVIQVENLLDGLEQIPRQEPVPFQVAPTRSLIRLTSALSCAVVGAPIRRKPSASLPVMYTLSRNSMWK